MSINEKHVKFHINSIQQRNESTLTKHNAVLLSIHERLEDTNRFITSSNSVTSKIADTLRLDWLRQLGTELKGFLRRIIAMNIATYHAVISIQAALPSRLERGLIEEPFILEDAIGRIAPVHLQFVTSWDAFNAVLEIRFKDLQGFKKVKEKQYGLQDKATGRDIDHSHPWQRAFLPGQRIEMSFVFNNEDTGNGKVKNTTCPGCQTPSSSLTTSDIQCENCRMWFRRITIIQDTELLPQNPVPMPWKAKAEFGKPGFEKPLLGPSSPGKRRITPEEIDGDDDMREFKRVRLILRKKRFQIRPFGKPRSRRDLITFSTLSNEPSVENTLPGSRAAIGNASVHLAQTVETLMGTEDTVRLHPAEIVKLDLENVRQAGLFRRKESNELELQVVGMRKRVLGAEHPDTLTSMANLASTYRDQGRWKEAEELQAKELKICSRVLGAKHPSTLTSMNNLALTFKAQDRKSVV